MGRTCRWSFSGHSLIHNADLGYPAGGFAIRSPTGVPERVILTRADLRVTSPNG